MGKVAQLKTKPTAERVEDFINNIADEQKRNDSFIILHLMEQLSGEKPKMWGASMIGFGEMRYKSPATGREVDWFKIGFSPRKANLSLYLTMNIQEHAQCLQQLGKHKTGAGCLYINKLDDINIEVLSTLIESALKNKLPSTNQQ